MNILTHTTTLADLYTKLSDDQYMFQLDKVYGEPGTPIRIVMTERATGRVEFRNIELPVLAGMLPRHVLARIVERKCTSARAHAVAALEATR